MLATALEWTNSSDSMQGTKGALLLNTQRGGIYGRSRGRPHVSELRRSNEGEAVARPLGQTTNYSARFAVHLCGGHVGFGDTPGRRLLREILPTDRDVMSVGDNSNSPSDDSTFNKWRRTFSLITGLGVTEEERLADIDAYHGRTCEKWKRELMNYSQY